MFKTNAIDSVNNRYVDEDPIAGINGTRLEADDRNIIQDELVNAVERSGQTLDPSGVFTRNFQLARAMFINGVAAQTFVDVGVANAYILVPLTGSGGVAVAEDYSQLDGAVLVFKPENDNTGATTVDIGQDTGGLLGTKKLLDITGNDLVGGELLAGTLYEIKYDSTADGGNGAWMLIGEKKPPKNYTTQIFTTSGTWTKPAGLKYATVHIIGGGGGGGGADGNSGIGGAAGGGGGSGLYLHITFPASVLGATETVIVGAGGAGGTGTGNGSKGGGSTFGSLLSAEGGGGGVGASASANAVLARGGDGGNNYTIVGGAGMVNHGIHGYPGIKGYGTNTAVSGAGGGFGGGRARNSTSDGQNATGFGSGGSGALAMTTTNTYTGGNGADGIVIILEYYQ